ncbi:MAG: hypothetical protein U1E25_13110 [Methylocystis sp.]
MLFILDPCNYFVGALWGGLAPHRQRDCTIKQAIYGHVSLSFRNARIVSGFFLVWDDGWT